MKKLSKSTFILIPIIITILISFIGIYNYRKPITIHKMFNEAIVIKPSRKEILKKTTIEINAKLYRGLYRGSALNFNAHLVNKLEGKIIIDNKEYSFYGITEKAELKNILGSVTDNNEGISEGLMFEMCDLDSILLVSTGKNESDYQVAAPAQTIEDYQRISDKLTN